MNPAAYRWADTLCPAYQTAARRAFDRIEMTGSVMAGKRTIMRRVMDKAESLGFVEQKSDFVWGAV